MDATVRLAARCLGLLVAAAMIVGLGASAGARNPADPVEKLRQILQNDTEDLPARNRDTKACLEELRSLSELRKAVLLREWRQFHPNAELAGIDRSNREALNARFRQALAKALTGNDLGATLAALEMLNETGSALREAGDPSLTRPLTAEVTQLVGGANPVIRAAAARTLGQIDPDLAIALPVLKMLTEVPDPGLRLDAAKALGQMLQGTVQTWTVTPFNPAANLDRRTTAKNAAQLLPLIGAGADDPVREVRQRSLTALELAASVLGKMVTLSGTEIIDPRDAKPLRTPDMDRAEARPLAQALNEQLVVVGGCLRVRDGEGKMAALKVLEETAQTRLLWLHHAASTSIDDSKPDDPLAKGLASALPGLAETLTDENLKIRRATLDVLEIYGPLAAAAAPAVTRALKDTDRFVRWSAVRTLGAIGPAARPAIPGLTKLLQDPDLDLRVAAAGVLETLDPKGQGPPKRPGQSNNAGNRSPLPALIQSLKSEQPEMQLAAIHALAAMGPNAASAVSALAVTLTDADPHVRLAAIRLLGDLGPAARNARDALQQALKDKDAEVRRAAGDALLNVQRVP